MCLFISLCFWSSFLATFSVSALRGGPSLLLEKPLRVIDLIFIII